MKRCVIIGAGEMPAKDAARAGISREDFVVCADAGYDNALAAGIEAHAVIGDFDSVSAVPCNVRCIVYPTEKDETDMRLAAMLGFERGCDSFLLLGALGGRLDHTLGNIQLMSFIAQKAVSVKAIGAGCVLYGLHDGEIEIEGEPGGIFSVFSLSDESAGVYIKGAKFPLADALVQNTSQIGVSNVFLRNRATVSVRGGTLLIICMDGEAEAR